MHLGHTDWELLGIGNFVSQLWLNFDLRSIELFSTSVHPLTLPLHSLRILVQCKGFSTHLIRVTNAVPQRGHSLACPREGESDHLL